MVGERRPRKLSPATLNPPTSVPQRRRPGGDGGAPEKKKGNKLPLLLKTFKLAKFNTHVCAPGGGGAHRVRRPARGGIPRGDGEAFAAGGELRVQGGGDSFEMGVVTPPRVRGRSKGGFLRRLTCSGHQCVEVSAKGRSQE